MGAPAFKERTRSAREGIWACVSLTLGDAAFKALADFVFGQIASDEDDAAVASLIRPPRALVIAIEDHVHTLEHEAFRVVLERKDALAPQNIGSLFCDQILHPRKKLVRDSEGLSVLSETDCISSS